MGVFAKIGENPQGRDVCSPDLVSKEGQGRGGHNATEYRLTLDMAKELAMVENNERGRQARRYFIECERAARTVNVPALPAPMSDPSHHKALLAATDEEAFWRAFKKHAANLKDAPLPGKTAAWWPPALLWKALAATWASRRKSLPSGSMTCPLTNRRP